MKKNNGITMISLTITIVILVILSSITVMVNLDAYNITKVQNFIAKMKAIQTRVDHIAEQNNVGEYAEITEEKKQVFSNIIAADTIDKKNSWNEELDSNIENYSYFTPQDLAKEIGLKDQDIAVFINFKTRNVIAEKGVKRDGKIYYRQYDLEGGDQLIPNLMGGNEQGAPTIELNLNESTTWAKTATVRGTIKDKIGLKQGVKIKYGWSTSLTTEPTSYTDANVSYQDGEKIVLFEATSSGLTGKYYLWIVPEDLQNTQGNKQTEIVKSTGTFWLDNTAPNLTLTQESLTKATSQTIRTQTFDGESGISVVKWAAGSRDLSYFNNAGINISSNTAIEVTTQSYFDTMNLYNDLTGDKIYTVYAKDNSGNEIVKTIKVENLLINYTFCVGKGMYGTNGATVKGTSILLPKSNACQYGPYVKLPVGSYTVYWDGISINNCNFRSYCSAGTETVIPVFTQSSGRPSATFTLNEVKSGVEFVSYNQSNVQVEVMGVTLVQNN